MGLGMTELIIVALIVLLLFGGKKLPQLGSALGSAIQNFKKGIKEADKEKSEEQISSEKNND